jgi:hypothetical protein
MVCRRIKAYCLGTKQSQRSKLSAQQESSLARRRLFHARTIAGFESRFRYQLWKSKKEHLAQLLYLRLDKPVSNEDAIWDAFLSLEQAQDLAKITYNNLRNKSKICDDLKSSAIKENAEDTSKYTREAVEEKDNSKLDKIEDRETEKALK